MQNKKIKIMFAISLIIISFLIVFLCYAFKQRNIIKENYAKGKQLLESEKYDQAIAYFIELKEYKDGSILLKEAKQGSIYVTANKLLNNKRYSKSIKEFNKIVNYKDSKKKIRLAKYKLAVQFYENGNIDKAKQIFLELDKYKKSKYYLAKINLIQKEESQKIIYNEACELFDRGIFDQALENFKSILDYKDSKEKVKDCEKKIKRKNLNNTISGGIRYSVAIFKDGKVKAVGDNDKKQCEVKKFKNMVSVDAGGCLTIGLNNKGKIEVAGTYDEDIKIDTMRSKWKDEKFIDIASGERFVVGLTENGKVIADGHNDDSQIDLNKWDKQNFIAIDAGWRFTVGFTENKELKFSGLYGNQLKDFEDHKDEWKDVVNISAAGGDTTEKQRGKGHTVGLKLNGEVVAVGDNSWGQCEVYGKKWKNIVKVVAGDWYTVGLKDNGQVLITGKNRPGTRYIEEDILEKANRRKDIVDIAAGYGQTILVHKTGEITAFGFDEEGKYSKTKEWKISNPS